MCEQEQGRAGPDPLDIANEKRLTAQELIQYPGFKYYTEAQAQAITETIHSLSEFLYELITYRSVEVNHDQKQSNYITDKKINQINKAA